MDPDRGHRRILVALACAALAAASAVASPAVGNRAPAAATPSARGDSGVNAESQIDPAARREDWRWLNRFPDETTHRDAESADLQVVIGHLRQANERLAELLAQRPPLDREAEFHHGKPLPPELQRKIDANDASFTALADVFRLLEQDVSFIVARFGAERRHLRRLWAGAPPGSIGFFQPVSAPAR